MQETEFHRIDAIVAGPLVPWTPEGWAEAELKKILGQCTPVNLDTDTVIVRRRKRTQK